MDDYRRLLSQAFILYIQDWCQKRGYSLADWNPEHGFNGESYVCFEAFEETEFQDEGYMETLLSPEDFHRWLLEMN